MKQVFYIPISSNAEDTEFKINEAITKISKDFSIEWLINLCKSTDNNKYMLVGEKEDGTGVATPEIGVKVITSSQDMRKTEDIINNTLLEMELDEDKNFISICRPSEFIYIILYEYKAGSFPRVKIIPNPADPYIGSRRISMLLNILDDDPEWKLQPYDSFMIDKDNMIILFSEE